MNIESLNNEGFSAKEIAEKLDISRQKVSAELKKLEKLEVEVLPVDEGIRVFTASEYAEYSKSQGRNSYGGEYGVPVKATVEELRAYINSGWKPSMLMEKWQYTEEMMVKLVHKLSKAELRAKAIVVNFKNDFFR